MEMGAMEYVNGIQCRVSVAIFVIRRFWRLCVFLVPPFGCIGIQHTFFRHILQLYLHTSKNNQEASESLGKVFIISKLEGVSNSNARWVSFDRSTRKGRKNNSPTGPRSYSHVNYNIGSHRTICMHEKQRADVRAQSREQPSTRASPLQ